MSASTPTAAPVTQTERISLLDSLRGIAILGILLMNMPAFALAPVISNDPSVLNELGTINYYIWYFIGWVMNGTQRALFSMLFGAGVILFVGRQENKLAGLAPADYFFRRQIWLIVISLFDVYILLWHGDILFDYACLGMIMFAFRKLSPKALIIAATVCLLFLLARENRDFFDDKMIITKGEAVAAMDTTQVKLTTQQKDDLDAMTSFKKRMTQKSKLKRMKETNEIVQGAYPEVYKWRTDHYVNTIVQYLYFEAWDVLVFMFLGMAFFKLGILTGTAPLKWYAWMAIIGYGAGLSITFIRMQLIVDHHFNYVEILKGVPFAFYQFDRTLRSIGFLGTVMLLYKSGVFGWLFALVRPAGQMALTNYLGQSLICGIIFNGYGFGLFGKLQRYEIYLVVLAVWSFQIVFSAIWMRSFIYGPCEWVWRSLTYWKAQPLKRGAAG